MKRKVIKQGHNTLTITLPSGWTAQQKLNAGDEVNIVEASGDLIITSQPANDRKNATMDISGLDIPTIWKYIMAVYREGYDEIEVSFNPDEQYENPFKFYNQLVEKQRNNAKPQRYKPNDMLTMMVSRFLGFEIIENYPNKCIIHDMVDFSSKEFHSSLRRVFLLIKQMSEELHDAIKANDRLLVRHAHDIDINIDKFNDYCLRVLAKNQGKDIKKTHLLFATLYLLELIGDEFKHIMFHIVYDMENMNLKQLLELNTLIKDQYAQYYDLYYNFQKEKLTEFSKRDFKIHAFVPSMIQKKRSQLTQMDHEIFNHFRRIGHYLNALVELRVEMEF